MFLLVDHEGMTWSSRFARAEQLGMIKLKVPGPRSPKMPRANTIAIHLPHCVDVPSQERMRRASEVSGWRDETAPMPWARARSRSKTCSKTWLEKADKLRAF